MINIHDHLRSKLSEAYENDSIFDKFKLSSSYNGQYMITGSYNDMFNVHDLHGFKSEKVLEAAMPRAKPALVKKISFRYEQIVIVFVLQLLLFLMFRESLNCSKSARNAKPALSNEIVDFTRKVTQLGIFALFSAVRKSISHRLLSFAFIPRRYASPYEL